MKRIFGSRTWRDQKQAGFTLLEMMLTVFLIGISISLIIPRIGNDADDVAKLEARRFSALVTHLQDEATIVGLPMGVEVSANENRYRFWQLADGWTQVEKQQVLREREVPESVQMSFTLLQDKQSTASQSEGNEDGDDEDGDDEESKKQSGNRAPSNLLVVEPNGLIVPFFAGFAGEKKDYRVSLDTELNTVISENER